MVKNMSNYTTQLRYIINSGIDIGLRKYPIFDEAHRNVLNQKLIEHYWMDEIGSETIQMFVFRLNRNMNEIMPYYNELYKSALIEFNPLEGYNLTEILSETEKNNSIANANGTSNGNGKNLFNDTPQNAIGQGDILSQKYATNITLDETKTETTSNTNSNSQRGREEMRTTKGSQYHNPSELLQSYRETILNIDMMVIEDEKISSCFMSLLS